MGFWDSYNETASGVMQRRKMQSDMDTEEGAAIGTLSALDPSYKPPPAAGDPLAQIGGKIGSALGLSSAPARGPTPAGGSAPPAGTPAPGVGAQPPGGGQGGGPPRNPDGTLSLMGVAQMIKQKAAASGRPLSPQAMVAALSQVSSMFNAQDKQMLERLRIGIEGQNAQTNQRNATTREGQLGVNQQKLGLDQQKFSETAQYHRQHLDYLKSSHDQRMQLAQEKMQQGKVEEARKVLADERRNLAEGLKLAAQIENGLQTGGDNEQGRALLKQVYATVEAGGKQIQALEAQLGKSSGQPVPQQSSPGIKGKPLGKDGPFSLDSIRKHMKRPDGPSLDQARQILEQNGYDPDALTADDP